MKWGSMLPPPPPRRGVPSHSGRMRSLGQATGVCKRQGLRSYCNERLGSASAVSGVTPKAIGACGSSFQGDRGVG